MKNDSLGARMKAHEAVAAGRLVRRCPVIVRVDGRAFHSWTRGLRPFYEDQSLSMWMREAAQRTAHEMQGCKLAYVQSDEASFLLADFDSIETQPWFGYELPKVVSISASAFTAFFASASQRRGCPTFDARAFNVPMDDVANYFLWRAKDWRRNSILGLAQAHFSPKQLHGVNQAGALAMLAEKGIKWGDLEPALRCGSFFFPRGWSWLYDVEPHYPEVEAVVARALAPPEWPD